MNKSEGRSAVRKYMLQIVDLGEAAESAGENKEFVAALGECFCFALADCSSELASSILASLPQNIREKRAVMAAHLVLDSLSRLNPQ